MGFANNRQTEGESLVILTVLVVLLLLSLLGGGLGASRGWGYYGWSPLGLLIVVVLVMALTGNLSFLRRTRERMSARHARCPSERPSGNRLMAAIAALPSTRVKSSRSSGPWVARALSAALLRGLLARGSSPGPASAIHASLTGTLADLTRQPSQRENRGKRSVSRPGRA